MIRIAINLDLMEDAYAALKEASDPADFEVDNLPSAPLRGERVELAFFFSRQAERQPSDLSRKLGAIEKACAAAVSSFADCEIERAVLVDCGDTFMQPLSDVTVLSLYLETIRETLAIDVDAVVFVADRDAEDEVADIVIRDTRSEDFVEHMANYTRRALSTLNISAGGD